MNNLILKKIYEIQADPRSVIGRKSLLYLRHYLNGYRLREMEQQPLTDDRWGKFQEFVQQYYSTTSSHGWAEIITFYEDSDEAAFDKFYQLLEAFLSMHPQPEKE